MTEFPPGSDGAFEAPIDLDNLPPQPPAGVAQPMMWRMAVRLLADHRPRWTPVPGRPRPACRTCGQIWPCRGRRLGERGLLAASREPPRRPPAGSGPPAGSDPLARPDDPAPGAAGRSDPGGS